MTQPVNPYVAGIPLRGKEGFFGRQEILKWVTRELRNPGTNALVLAGQRRIGKTSLLLQLNRILPADTFLPIYFDLQDQATRPLGQVLAALANKVARQAGAKSPDPNAFDVYGRYFHETFLPKFYQTMGETRRLVLLFDEFDALDQATKQELAEVIAAKALFPFLRRVMEDPRLAFVFAVGRQVEDLSLDFTAIFKGSLSKEIWVLNRESAEELVRQAETNDTLRFTKRAVDRLLGLTSGHPYLTQLICQRIWERAYKRNLTAMPTVDLSEVKAAVSDALEAGKYPLTWLWNGLSYDEQIYAAALAEVADKEGETISEDQVRQVLITHVAYLDVRELEQASRYLVKRRVLEESGEREYRFAVEFFRRWVRRYQPLQEVTYKLDRVDLLAERSFEVGLRAFRRDDWETSIPYFRETLVANPGHLRARLCLGKALLELDLPKLAKEAVGELKKAYELDQSTTRSLLTHALVTYAMVLKQEGDKDGALKICEEALQLSPNDQQAQEMCAAVRNELRNAASGQKVLDVVPITYWKTDARQNEESISPLQFVSTPHVITITGASRAGKSTTVGYLLAYTHAGFKPKLVPKYTTRRPRSDDRDSEAVCLENIPPQCDLIYEQYGERYGLELRALFELVANGQSPVVILNDVRVVEDVRNAFRELVKSIFIFRQDPLSKEYHQELIESRGRAGQVRFEKAQTLYRIYIENIHLFNHVIINSGTFDELEMQVRQIVKDLNQGRNQLLREGVK